MATVQGSRCEEEAKKTSIRKWFVYEWNVNSARRVQVRRGSEVGEGRNERGRGKDEFK